MEPEARPPLLSPLPLAPSDDEEEPPVWEPTALGPCPPPLPSPPVAAPGRALTSKQFKALSLLPAVLGGSGAAADVAPPLLPVDLPAVRRLEAGRASDSEGAVTSRAVRRGAAPLAEAAEKEDDRDEELVEMLEETLLQEEQALQAKSPLKRPPRQRRTAASAPAPAPAPPPAPAQPSSSSESEESSRESDSRSESESETESEGEATAAAAEGPTGDGQEEGDDKASVSVAQKAREAALKSVGFASWGDLLAHVTAAAAAARGPGGGSTRRRGKPKPASEIKDADITNPKSPFYHPLYAKAYRAARAAMGRAAAKERRGAAVRQHTAVLPVRWSSVSARDHSFFLAHQGRRLVGAEAERFTRVAAALETERSEYWNDMDAYLETHRSVYAHQTDRQAAQQAADLTVRRRRAAALPRLWRIRGSVGLPSAALGAPLPPAAALPMERELLRRGEAPLLRTLPPGTSLHGNKLYLPAALGAAEGLGPRTGPSGDVYRKAVVPEPWEDSDMAKAAAAVEGTEGKEGTVVCAAAGALACMLRSALLEHRPAWEVPAVVEAGGRCFLGKPLLPAQETLRERQRRLHKYAALSEATMRPAGRAARGGAPAPREALYWQSTLGGGPLAVRTHARVQIAAESTPQEEKKDGKEGGEDIEEAGDRGSAAAVVSVFAATPEYLPDPDEEQATAEELAGWWAKLATAPGAAQVALAHASLPRCRVTRWQALGPGELADEWGSGGVAGGAAVAAAAAVIAELRRLPPGRYLLRHTAEKPEVEVWASVEEESLEGLDSEKEGLYDLHAAQQRAGEVDATADVAVPPRWRPYDPAVAQVPYTFPPDPKRGAGGGGRRKRERPGGGRGGGGSGGRGRRRRRGYDNPWSGDLDTMGHTAQISREGYAAALEEGL